MCLTRSPSAASRKSRLTSRPRVARRRWKPLMQNARSTDMRRALLSVAVAVTLAGCMMGPDYKRPAIDSPQAYRVEVKSSADLINSPWWEQFNDPTLNDLIKTALAENKDVRIAASRVEEFLGRYGVTRSQLFPQVSTQFGAGSQRISNSTQPALGPGQTNTFD